MADMQELIARLEAAEAGSAELDEAVALACGSKTQGWAEWASDGTFLGSIRPYSTSLDAALALAERVLPDWAWEIRLDRGGASVQTAPAWWMEGLAAPDEGGVSCDGKTPALALCIAILKAKAQGEGG